VLHGCVVEDDALIAMAAVILNGATIGKGSLIAAGAWSHRAICTATPSARPATANSSPAQGLSLHRMLDVWSRRRLR
jgi:acetyltransferase-like isoleucine patch superfamily enzyme